MVSDRVLKVKIVDGAIDKLKKVGTLINVLKMIMQVGRHKLKICVSYRSYEIEDTFMCDFVYCYFSGLYKNRWIKKRRQSLKI